jgi:hypothetical protein
MTRTPPPVAAAEANHARPAGRRPWRAMRPRLACLAVLAAMALLSACDDESSTEAPASGAVASPADSTAGSALPADALPVAEAFVSALADLDVPGIRAGASDAVFGTAFGATPELVASWRSATGFVLIPDQCRPTSEPGVVSCDYDYHGLRSEEMGLGPYGGSQLDLTVESGQVVSIDDQIEYEANGFSKQVWEPFAQWMQARHPKDVTVMYEPDLEYAVASPRSIKLWKARTKEYVAETR